MRFMMTRAMRRGTVWRSLSSNPSATNIAPKRVLKAAILDWSGTTADNYVIAPADAFCQVFLKHKVPISMAEARGPMGLRKDLHIEALLNVPAIRGRWIKVHGKAPTEETVKNMFKDFVPLQLAVLPKYTRLIPGTAATVQQLRDEFQLRIGMTTGFQQEMTAILLAAAKQQGFSPDVHVAGDEVTKPRPWPYMVWKNMERLQLADPSLVVKVDDTASGIGEGLNAGAWTVGCYATSNYMDIDSPEHRNSLSTEEFERRAQKSRDILRAAGAHVLIRDITWLPGAIRQLNHRLARGEYPPPFV